ncbi:NCLDV Major Capsid Protein [Pleurochrysis sp. endemic virus 1a]|nr:NCLDV Major Capsid Protein [Pleurochrysis sp. endemic virus 1a]
MPQLQINQGPQDALLYDNSRSYFTNVGYVRTSNFQLELRDVDPQNSANFGSTVQFVIPKAADLLGPVDLMLDLNKVSAVNSGAGYAAWVESLGFAAIERITFSVGSHDIEEITGDMLNIMNELMTKDEQRMGLRQILKTGRPAVAGNAGGSTSSSMKAIVDTNTDYDNTQRLLHSTDGTEFDGKKLIIPLGLFFTKHPSQYFPLAAIAGCNDVRIAVKFRTLNELLLLRGTPTVASGVVTDVAETQVSTPTFASGTPIARCQLRCHYVHVTGPEATTLMNKEHVRLLKLWHANPKPITLASTSAGTKFNVPIDLSFLHPVQSLVITIRKTSEMSSSLDNTAKPKSFNQGAKTKNYYAYHGGGKDPNIDSLKNSITGEVAQPNLYESYIKVEDFKLSLNGQERHPSLASSGLDRNYLMNRMMPMLHSSTKSVFSESAEGSAMDDSSVFDAKHLAEVLDRKEIYVYPFSLNPEGANPSGAVNFSKVSHAKLNISGVAYSTSDTPVDYQVDVYAVYYNWLQIKDGRALTSFA